MRKRSLASCLIVSMLGLVALVPVNQPVAEAGATTTRASLKSDVCYQIVTDRFYDGNTANNNPSVSAGLYDGTKANWKLYWGGDFAGIQAKAAYLKDLGVTSVWISPPVDNINKASYYNGVPNAGYHGYWARDFKNPEEHFGTWTDFDNMVNTLHSNGIKVTVDLAPNHTSPADANDTQRGEQGALYNGTTFMGNYLNDTNSYFHHNGGTNNWDDRYEVQYKNMADLSDLNQANTTIDGYLRDMGKVWLNRNVDGVRVDAVKHMPWGWQKSWADTLYATKDVFMFGEWYANGINDPLYGDTAQYANRTGISLLDFPLNKAIRDTFGYGSTMQSLWDVQAKVDADFTYKENLVTFIDNHDMARFGTINGSQDRLHQALGFILTNRGTPCIYYGTEQYLYNSTGGGTDPYNRPMMTSWSNTTTAYKLIKSLSSLRQTNPAIQFGSTTQRWINNDVLIFERKFYNDVALIAINKGSSSYSISGLLTALPAGTYSDYLAGLQKGNSITVGSGTGDRAVNTFTLGANAVSVWHYKAAEPTTAQVGSVGPVLGRAGNTITIEGRGFGTSTGTVKVGGTAATIVSWSNNVIKAKIPTVTAGIQPVTVTKYGSTTASNSYNIEVLSKAQVPVTFAVRNATPTSPGDYIYITGNVWELGNWSTSKSFAIGPMLAPNYPDWFLTVSLPAGTTVQYKYIKVTSGGSVLWENGSNHTYTTPASGTGSVTDWWQY